MRDFLLVYKSGVRTCRTALGRSVSCWLYTRAADISDRFRRGVSLLLCVHGDAFLCGYDPLEPQCGRVNPFLGPAAHLVCCTSACCTLVLFSPVRRGIPIVGLGRRFCHLCFPVLLLASVGHKALIDCLEDVGWLVRDADWGRC